MRIDIWSDIVCPWCYIGKRRLERALAEFPGRDDVEIVHHAFQLDPSTPAGSTQPRRARLKAKYGMSDDQVATMDERLEQLAALDGLDFDLSGGETGNTFDAHRLVQCASTVGLQNAVIERLYRAYFTEGRSVFDAASLTALALEAGLTADAIDRVLTSNDFADQVHRDRRTAADLGVQGVPFFVVDGRFGISGAQPVETFIDALRQAATPADAEATGDPA